MLYLAEIGSVGSGLEEEGLVFADAVLMEGLLASCLVGHLLGERTGLRAGGRGEWLAWQHSWVFTSAWLFCDLPGKSITKLTRPDTGRQDTVSEAYGIKVMREGQAAVRS